MRRSAGRTHCGTTGGRWFAGAGLTSGTRPRWAAGCCAPWREVAPGDPAPLRVASCILAYVPSGATWQEMARSWPTDQPPAQMVWGLTIDVSVDHPRD